MKQNMNSIAVLLILVFLFISTSHTSSRNVASKQDVMIKSKNSATEMENTYSFHNLMEVEECGNEEEEEDEECLNRRVLLADAHLDYIYSQDHKP